MSRHCAARVISNRILAIYRRILPDMSQTEKEAIDAGTVWWDADLFSGKPDWDKLLAVPEPRLSAEEQAFLDGPVEELCAMLNDWEITHERQDLPEHVWQFIKDKGFLGMIIPKQYGGLGFSALAHSAVVMKLSTRSSTAAISVMVPNSLGPGELLMHYGTEQQKNHYLPRLAKGLEVPCFALTNPEAGSDAAAIPDFGIVCKGTWQGREVLGMRVTWDKRYITLGPVATLLGLAFRLYDPEKLLGEKADLGITCALVPTNTPGVNIGRRHLPLNQAFQNGPNSGKDVFMPLDWIIGGPEYAGKGWMMLMGCLAAGRAISLPTSSVGGAKALTRFTGAYARVRSQFKTPIGKLEGVEEALGRIAAQCYMMDATRVMTAGAVDLGRETGGAFRDRQVPHDRARARLRERRHGHPRRQGHLPRAEQLDRPRLPALPGRHHGGRREHPDAHADHLRPGRDPLPPLRAARDARGEGNAGRRGEARVRRRLHLAYRPRGAQHDPHPHSWIDQLGLRAARLGTRRWKRGTTTATFRAYPRRLRSSPTSRCWRWAGRSSARRRSPGGWATCSPCSTSCRRR